MKKGRFTKMVLSGTVAVLTLMLNAQNVQTEKANLMACFIDNFELKKLMPKVGTPTN